MDTRKYRVYVKRSTVEQYEVEAESEAMAEAMAKKHLEEVPYLSDNTTDSEGEEVDTPFEHISGDDTEEEYMSVEEADDSDTHEDHIRNGEIAGSCDECNESADAEKGAL